MKVNKVIVRFFTKAQQKTRMDRYRPLKSTNKLTKDNVRFHCNNKITENVMFHYFSWIDVLSKFVDNSVSADLGEIQ